MYIPPGTTEVNKYKVYSDNLVLSCPGAEYAGSKGCRNSKQMTSIGFPLNSNCLVFTIKASYFLLVLAERSLLSSIGHRNMEKARQSSNNDKKKIEILRAISDKLETGLTEEALGAITDLLRAGVHPDAVVAVVTSLNQYAQH
jgi:hypothetical protein